MDPGVNPASANWTDDEIRLATAILEKIAFCQQQTDTGLPGHVFEAHLRGKKNVATELVLLNDRREIYLVRRPTREENTSEVFPGALHSPGVIHMARETLADTFERLRVREGIPFQTPVLACEEEYLDPVRGMYFLRIFIALATGEPINPRGKWFAIADIPWSEVVASHRDIIIPMAIAAAARRMR